MNQQNSFRNEPNIAKMLDKAVDLFMRTGLTELAEKWDLILGNYLRAKNMRKKTA